MGIESEKKWKYSVTHSLQKIIDLEYGLGLLSYYREIFSS